MNTHLSKLKHALSVFFVLLGLSPFWLQAQGVETITTGSFLINMGNSNAASSNDDLYPYGLIYDLLRNHKVPVKCAINPSKSRDGIDFSHNGIDYKGGTYIIPAAYRTEAVNAKISAWQTLGVVGATSVSDFSTSIAYTIDYYPIWTLDHENGKIAKKYLQAAGFTSSFFVDLFPNGEADQVDNLIYDWILPANLDCCHDLFVLPHADPSWSVHNRLLSWNLDCKGAIWAGCNAVSHLENTTNPSDREVQMNFLSTKNSDRTIVVNPYVENSLILDTRHDDPTTPFTWLEAADPVAQYIGLPGNVYTQGAEQVYIPIQTAGKQTQWRSGVKVLGYDPSHPDVASVRSDLRNAPALSVYGRGFDDPDRGYVMYQAGHEYKTGKDVSSSEYAAAVRPFLNFSFFQMGLKAPEVDSILGIANFESLKSEVPVLLTASASSPLVGAQLSFQWSASCGGTFSNDTAQSTYFTPAAVGREQLCVISVSVTDECGRTAFWSSSVNIIPGTLAVADYNATVENMPVSGRVLTNDFDPNGDLLLFQGFELPSSPGSFATGRIDNIPGVDLLGNTVANAGYFDVDALGLYTFTPVTGFTGKVQVAYQIKDDAVIPSTYQTSLTLHVVRVPDPSDSTSNAIYTNVSAVVTYGATINANVLLNDGDPEGHPMQVQGISYDADGDGFRESTAIPGVPVALGGYHVSGAFVANAGLLSINANGAYSFSPSPGFAGQVMLMYATSDVVDVTYQSADSALLIIEVWPHSSPQNNAPFAGDDFAVTYKNVPIAGNWARNDSERDLEMVQLNQSILTVDLNNLSGVSVLSSVSTVAGGSVQFLSDGSYVYTPPSNYVGPDRVVYLLCDAGTTNPKPLCDSATVYFLVHTQERDYGDLSPLVWSPAWNLYLDQDNNNIPDGVNSVWLGEKVSSEMSSGTCPQANCDLYDDGVSIPSLLDTVNGSTMLLTLNGARPELPVYYKVFIDWNTDGIFDSTYSGGVVFNGTPVQVQLKYFIPEGEDGCLLHVTHQAVSKDYTTPMDYIY